MSESSFTKYVRGFLTDFWNVFLSPFRLDPYFTIFGTLREWRETRRIRRIREMDLEVHAELQRMREQRSQDPPAGGGA